MWTLVLILLAILLPPLPVFLMDGVKRAFWINLVLTLLGWLPGTAHAIYLACTRKT